MIASPGFAQNAPRAFKPEAGRDKAGAYVPRWHASQGQSRRRQIQAYVKAWRRPLGLSKLLRQAASGSAKPTAFALAGHNGSGKTTLWNERLARQLQIPLVNADRITASILPPAGIKTGQLPPWAKKLRDNDTRWQRLSQAGVQAFVGLIMERQMPFAFETVFSHWQELPDGSVESKADIIKTLQTAGYFVVLLFVGLSTVQLSVLRVETRKEQGGHGVPRTKLDERFPRTQRAIGLAAPIAATHNTFSIAVSAPWRERGSRRSLAHIKTPRRSMAAFKSPEAAAETRH
jgi:predicted ABC-type ATPase